MVTNATHKFRGQRGVIDATVLPKEIREANAANRKATEAMVKGNEEYRRVKKGVKKLPHTLPAEETYGADGETISTRPKTVTKRRSH